MTVEEIFSQLAQHMIKGVMFHEQLANYYDFLGLNGYKRCHEYHYLSETCDYRGLCRYYINHHNKLIPIGSVEDPNVIPENWYKYTRQDIESATKVTAVKNGMQLWVDWEKETKKLYEKMYQELMNIGEVASALKVKELVCDVDRELKKAERYQLNKQATNYDMVDIMSEQHRMHEEYKEKQEKIGVYIC
ncbi:MAG: hypothetical protein J1F01_08620 [Oscillospiraceae bacterium]|nr:hypothetical protein [Oscillospiraceae bacterium]